MLRLIALLLSGVVLLLSGCGSTFRDRSEDYRRTQVLEPLKLPPSVESRSLGNNYPVPRMESHVVLPGAFETPRPEPLVQDVEQGVVRIQKLGDQHWILLNGTPGQIWPRVRGFLSVSDLPVAHTDAVNGLIDTAWLQPRGEGLPPERYRFRIDQGVQRGTSEIHVLQADRSTGEHWPQTSSSSDREQEMTRALAQYLADSEAASSVSMLAQQNVDARGKVLLAQEPERGEHYIRLQLPFDRGWAALGLALEKAGFKIDDLNRGEGRYWVSLDDKAEKESWWRRVFGDDDVEQAGYHVDIRLMEGDSGILKITLSPREGTELDAETREKLLNRIKGYIS